MKAVTRRNENIPFGESEFVTDLVYGSYLRVVDQLHGLDSTTRDISYAQELLNALGIQADRWPRATVTGSKGKGSVSVLLASILAASGEHVGLVTSPHMRSFTERIRIDGRCVSNEELEEAAHQIAPAVHSITDRIPPLRYLGPGGVILALAYSIFAKHKVTAVVIEAGRGGEYDEARLVKANVSVLTPIMLEHPDKLGPTVKDIVITKTRITAPGSTIISSPQSPIVRAMMQQTATEIGSEVKEAGKDILIKKQRHQDLGVVCDLQLTNIVYSNLYINLGGLHQTENAATAILAAQALSTYEVKCTREGIYAGFKNVHWPGRAQFLQQNPWVFLDGAINRESAKYACDVVSQYPAKQVTAVIAVPKPKDLAGVCHEVSRITQRVILTEAETPTLSWYEDAIHIASKYFTDVQRIGPATHAFKHALKQTSTEGGIVLLGTQSFLGEALSAWGVDTCAVW